MDIHLFGTYHFPPCRDVPKPGPDPLPTLGCPGDPALPRGGRSGAEREERTKGSRVEGLGEAAEKTGATLTPGDLGLRRASGEVKTAATHRSVQTRKLGKKAGATVKRFHLPSERVAACLPIRKCWCRESGSGLRHFRPAPLRHRAAVAARWLWGCDSRRFLPSLFPGLLRVGWDRVERDPKTKKVGQSPSADLLIHAVYSTVFFFLRSVCGPGVNKMLRANLRKTENKLINQDNFRLSFKENRSG